MKQRRRSPTLASVSVAALALLTLARPGGAEPAAIGADSGHAVAVGGSEFDRLLGRFVAEVTSLQAEMAAGSAELAVVHQRVILRGRTYYKLVRAGLLPAGGGFDALVDHAAKVERTRLALERLRIR